MRCPMVGVLHCLAAAVAHWPGVVVHLLAVVTVAVLAVILVVVSFL